jgi:cation:H+ antiporter
MEQIMYFILFGLGLFMIIKGSDWFLDAVVWMAEVLRIPHIIIGATIVSLCTTLPETFVSVTAAFHGETDVALGNAIGSIAVNTGLVLSLLLIFGRPKITQKKDFIIKGLFLIFVMSLCWFFGLRFGQISQRSGIVLICLLLFFLVFNVQLAKKSPTADLLTHSHSKKNFIKNIGMFTVGIFLVVLGSHLLVHNGTAIAYLLGVPSIVIALTMTSFGTSLPELVTTIRALYKGVHDIGVGNIIGANTLNIVQVIGFSSLVAPIRMDHDPAILRFQIPVALLLVCLTVLFGVSNKKRFRSSNGFMLLWVYCVYLAFSILREATPILGWLVFS